LIIFARLTINPMAMLSISPLLLFFNLSTGELLIILSAVLLFFGAKRIPELAKGLGKGIREFKDASTGIRKEIDQEIDQDKSSGGA